MNRSIRCSQPLVHEFAPYPVPLAHAQAMLGVSPEINRLLTAAVVNRRFCCLLLANPLRALTLGYRGEAFQLDPAEVRRVTAIRATSLRDFALQLLMNDDVADTEKTLYTKDRQEIALFVR